jgi:acetolactate synthase-1/2/3 large subunit
MRVADLVLDFVARQGVGHVFLVTGGGAMHLNDALARAETIRPVCNAHEQASAIAAEAYAKATGDLGVAMVTTGPGGTNAVTGVAGAWLDSTPTLFISGQVKRPDRMFDAAGKPLGMRQLGVQEVDIVSIVRPITKYAVTVLEPTEIRYHLEKSVHLARTGRPGPVWIDIPLDVQAAPIGPFDSLPGFTAPAGDAETADLAEAVAEVIAALNRAERPLLFVGNGVRLARGEPALRRLYDHVVVPTATTWCAADLGPADRDRAVGRPGSLAARGANFALQNADFLLAIGTRLDFSITGYAPQNLAREARKIVVDIDAAELAKLAPHVDQPIVADAKAFLDEFLRQIDDVAQPDRSAWTARCADWKRRYPVVTDEHRSGTGRISTYHFAELLGEAVGPDDIMVSGSSGSAIELFLLACQPRHGQRVFHNAGLGAMGYGIPAAIGVCLGAGGGRTLCVDGDGGFQFNIQELETVARLRLPITFFVLNNDGYASIRTSQRNYFGGASIGCDAANGVTVPDVTRVARAFGISGAVLERRETLRADLSAVLAMPGPVVCDVRLVPDEIRAPRLASVQRADGGMVSKPLEDLWPFLDRAEFHANMIVRPLPE